MKILPGGSDEGETGIEQAGREGGEGSMKKRKRRIKLFPQTKKLVRLWEDQCEGWFQQRNETVPVEDVRHVL